MQTSNLYNTFLNTAASAKYRAFEQYSVRHGGVFPIINQKDHMDINWANLSGSANPAKNNNHFDHSIPLL